MARSLVQLATQARVLYPKGARAFSTEAFVLWIQQGWAEFAQVCGHVWRVEDTLALAANSVGPYTLPEDLRTLLQIDVPQPTTEEFDIVSIVRSNNVVTVEVDTANTWASGDTVAIDGVTNTTFDEASVEITFIDATHFLYIQTGADATSSGGTATNAWETLTDTGLTKLEMESDIRNYTIALTTPGRPCYYYFTDGLHISLLPAPSSDFPEAELIYDGNVPADWSETATLPVPTIVEMGLLGYARQQAAMSLDPIDEVQMQRGAADFLKAKQLYSGGLTLRGGNKKRARGGVW